MSKFLDLKSNIVSFFNEDVSVKETNILQEKEEVTIEPPSTVEEHDKVPSVYAEMDKIEPKNPKVKAAYINKARQGATLFVFVIEQLDKADDSDTFYARAALVCRHSGKPVYSAVSFVQRANNPIAPNLFKLIPIRGTIPTWVRAYVDSSVEAAEA